MTFCVCVLSPCPWHINIYVLLSFHLLGNKFILFIFLLSFLSYHVCLLSPCPDISICVSFQPNMAATRWPNWFFRLVFRSYISLRISQPLLKMHGLNISVVFMFLFEWNFIFSKKKKCVISLFIFLTIHCDIVLNVL